MGNAEVLRSSPSNEKRDAKSTGAVGQDEEGWFMEYVEPDPAVEVEKTRARRGAGSMTKETHAHCEVGTAPRRSRHPEGVGSPQPLLAVPVAGGAPWLESPDFLEEYRVGVVAISPDFADGVLRQILR